MKDSPACILMIFYETQQFTRLYFNEMSKSRLREKRAPKKKLIALPLAKMAKFPLAHNKKVETGKVV